MKRLLLPILASCCVLGASADDLKAGYSSVTICSQTGVTTTVTLTDMMTTTFTDKDIVFADADNEVRLPLAQLRSYTFVEASVPEGISAPLLHLAGQPAEVYTADGRLVATTRSLQLEGLQPGTYIVRSGNVSFKINHK